MEMTLLGARLAALAALAWGGACGGNVVVDGMPDGSGGAGATSTSSVGVGATSTSAVGVGVTSTSGSWTTSSAVTSSSTGVGGGDARSMCVSYCELFQQRCGIGPGGGCGAACDEQLGKATACNDQLVPYFECLAGGASECDPLPIRCEKHLGAYEECAHGLDCAPLVCAGEGDRACHCKGSCRGVDLSIECGPVGRSYIVCSCLLDGTEVFACDGGGPACGLADDCCGSLFDAFR